MQPTQPPLFRRLLTTDDLAQIFHVSRATVRSWRRSGRVHGVQVGRELRFRRSDIEAIIGAHLEQQEVA